MFASFHSQVRPAVESTFGGLRLHQCVLLDHVGKVSPDGAKVSNRWNRNSTALVGLL